MTKPTSLPFTGDDEADRLLADEPLALLIGFALDQQVTVQKAFSGPAELKRRLDEVAVLPLSAESRVTVAQCCAVRMVTAARTVAELAEAIPVAKAQPATTQAEKRWHESFKKAYGEKRRELTPVTA